MSRNPNDYRQTLSVQPDEVLTVRLVDEPTDEHLTEPETVTVTALPKPIDAHDTTYVEPERYARPLSNGLLTPEQIVARKAAADLVSDLKHARQTIDTALSALESVL